MAGISFKNIKKSYGDVKVVHGITLDIQDGEFIVIVGPSGCGKSTLLRMVAGLEPITSGELTIGDRVVNNLEPKDRDCAMVFQNYALYPHMTVFDNMAYGLKIRGVPKEEIRRRVEQALRNVHAEALADKMTHHLSGGEKRAVSIATVLSMSPDILVLDEPSANLDPASRRTLISLLRQFTHTKIIATHDLDMVMDLCTRCIVMKDGSILADAPVPDIFADRSLLEEARLEQPLSYLLMRQERQRNNSGAS